MSPRQILLPASAHARVADQMAQLAHDVDILLWSDGAVTRPDGSAVDDEAVTPEAAWIPIDVFFDGSFLPYVTGLQELDSLRWVQACLAGLDAPPFQALAAKGVRLSNNDAPNPGVAEYVMGSVLHVVHGIGERVDNHRAGAWAQSGWREIGGMTWVVVGFGSIGREIAKRARPFGVEIVGVRRTAVDDPAADRMATMDALSAELADADVVVLACPLTDETAGLANGDFFAAMKPESILVNVARGPVVDTPALLGALDAGTPSTAILDVFDVEPLPADSPLWTHPSVFLTAHVAGAGGGITPRGDQVWLDQLDGYLAGRPLRLELS